MRFCHLLICRFSHHALTAPEALLQVRIDFYSRERIKYVCVCVLATNPNPPDVDSFSITAHP